MEYDRESKSVSVFMDDKIELLNVTYDNSARPIKWGPRNELFAEVELEYDRFSRLSSWKWGDITETYNFDRAGRLNEIKYSDGSSLVYSFKDMISSLVSNHYNFLKILALFPDYTTRSNLENSDLLGQFRPKY